MSKRILRPDFQIDREDRLFVSDDWISNGHWMLRRPLVAQIGSAPKGVKRLLSLRNGTYEFGDERGPDRDDVPDMPKALPETRDGYVPFESHPVGAVFGAFDVTAYIFESAGQQVRVATRYVPLLDLGYTFFSPLELRAGVSNPVLVLTKDDPNSELIAAVMPMRPMDGDKRPGFVHAVRNLMRELDDRNLNELHEYQEVDRLLKEGR